METWDGIVGGVKRAAFFVLRFVFVVPRSGMAWPLTGVRVMILRLISRFSDSDEKACREGRKEGNLA